MVDGLAVWHFSVIIVIPRRSVQYPSDASAHGSEGKGDGTVNDGLLDAIRHNVWATSEIFDACATLDHHQLNAIIPGTYGTIQPDAQGTSWDRMQASVPSS